MTLIPGCGKHRPGEGHQIARRFKRADQLADIIFNFVARDGFAVTGAGPRLTQIIREKFIPSFTPRGAKRHVTISAADRAAQGKVIADVFAQRYFRGTFAASLDFVEGLDRDQRLMVSSEPSKPIDFATDMPRIDRMRHDIGNTLVCNQTAPVAWKIRECFKVLLYLALRLESAQSKAFKAVLHNSCQRLMWHQHFASPLNGYELIPHWNFMYPVSRLHPRLHFLCDLTPVLLALQCALCGHNGFNKLAFGAFIELEVQAFDLRTALAERFTQIEVKARVACKALQIVEDYDERLTGLSIQKAQKGDHARPLHEVALAGYRIGKYRSDIVAFGCSV